MTLGNLFCAIEFGLAGLFLFIMVKNLHNFFFLPSNAIFFLPLIPGVSLSLEDFVYLLPGLAIGIFFHELMHAIVAAAMGLEVKSFGIAFLPLIPSFFVEVDEQEETSKSNMLKVSSSGPSANMLLGIMFLSFISIFTFFSRGILVVKTVPPASEFLKQDDVIVMINSSTIKNSKDFTNFLLRSHVNETIDVKTLDGRTFQIKLSHYPGNNSKPFLGISYIDYYDSFPTPFININYILFRLIFWAANINLSLAIINAAPIYFLDGEKFFEAIAALHNKKFMRPIVSSLKLISLLLLVSNLVLSLPSLFL
jgi:membrane-associated protease RseP (regulator of RpoE activity)